MGRITDRVFRNIDAGVLQLELSSHYMTKRQIISYYAFTKGIDIFSSGLCWQSLYVGREWTMREIIPCIRYFRPLKETTLAILLLSDHDTQNESFGHLQPFSLTLFWDGVCIFTSMVPFLISNGKHMCTNPGCSFWNNCR